MEWIIFYYPRSPVTDRFGSMMEQRFVGGNAKRDAYAMKRKIENKGGVALIVGRQ